MLVPFTWSFNQTITVEPNTQYLLSMEVRRHRGPSGARMAVNVRDEENNTVGSANIFHAFTSDQWETARGLLVTPAEAHHLILYLLTIDKNKSSDFYCDNVRIVPIGKLHGDVGRVWQVPDPLYRELLGDQPPGLVREGAMIWSHMLYVSQLRDVAARMGRRYSEDETYAHLAAHKLHPIRVPDDPHYAAHGVTTAIYPRTTAPGARSMLEPASIEFYLDNVRETLTKYPGRIWAIFAQDEAEEHALREIMALVKDPPEGYDYLAQIDREVREQFGGGEFGLPTGEGPDEPYRWIAFRRWINARFRERHRRLGELVHEIAPQVRLISTDPMGRLSPYEFSLQADLFDIFTHQFLPRSNPARCPLGLFTKVVVDLTGKEFWPCVHVENYAYHTTPEEVRELYSQVWRNGGGGFHLYLPDTANAGKKKGDTRLTQWGSPPRYRAILEIMDRAAHQNRLRFPPDEGCRIFYSNYANMAAANSAGTAAATEACYTLLGPLARSWFTFIDEHRLADPLTDVRPRAIYLPTAHIMDADTRERLVDFVREGGTLIVADPHAFDHDITGEDTSRARVELVGAESGGTPPRGTNLTVKPHALLPGIQEPLELPVLAPMERLTLAPGTTVLASCADGAPAVTLRKLGRGRVIYFALQPFNIASLISPEWQRFFKSLQKGLGFSTDLDIWRFKFPPFQTVEPPDPEGVCLTGNYVRWRDDVQHLVADVDTGGTYSLTPAPDAAGDDGGVTDIPFTAGDLTDRTKWPELEKTEAASYKLYVEPLSKWVDTWQAPGEVIVGFDFKTARPLLRAYLVVSGEIPPVVFEGSADGTAWAPLGRAEGLSAGADVLDMTITSSVAEPMRYARLRFGPRGDQPMTLAEVEIWGAR
ncbi:MAG: hypothetical protein J7M38_11600 [Armatimonadetes bacterium]|nr:hypothetical protein [Armatimonadota bacterium]